MAWLLALEGTISLDIDILGGDFNMVSNGALDWYPPRPEAHSAGFSYWRNIQMSWALYDICRRLCPEGSGPFTKWSSVPAGRVGSRLDWILAGEVVVDLCQKIELQVWP